MIRTSSYISLKEHYKPPSGGPGRGGGGPRNYETPKMPNYETPKLPNSENQPPGPPKGIHITFRSYIIFSMYSYYKLCIVKY